MNNKPQSMPVKEWLVSLTANKLGMNEELCDTIITWAYQKAKEATANSTIIEFSGFGKIYANGKKLDRKLASQKLRLDSLLNDDLSNMDEDSLKAYQIRLEDTQEYIKYLESKTNETKLERDMGGMEEQTLPTGTPEGANQADTRRKTPDL